MTERDRSQHQPSIIEALVEVGALEESIEAGEFDPSGAEDGDDEMDDTEAGADR